MSSTRKRVAMVMANNFEDSEAIDPRLALEAAGAEVVTIGVETGPVKGKKGAFMDVDLDFGDPKANPALFDGLVIPGGGAPENLRINDAAVAFTRAFVESGKPVASICHGPQLLISARVLNGRRITCVNKIRDDVTNAGANYEDAAVTIDGNLISSRTPADLPQFNAAIVKAIGL